MKPKCKVCGRKATKRVRVGLEQVMVLCNRCARILTKQAVQQGLTDLGGGMLAPEGAIVCTAARYGSLARTEYASAAVHRGSDVIEAEVYRTKELTDEEIAKRTLALAQKHGVAGVAMVSDIVPVELCRCCGELLIRIADGKGGSIAKTYKPHEHN